MNKVNDIISNLGNTVADFFNGKSPSVSLPEIERSAIDSPVSLGSLYDVRKDAVMMYGNNNIKSNAKYVKKKATCQLLMGADIKRENLLRIIQIDDETRLSLTLNITKRKGIASIIDYPFQIDNYTRLIYYFHQSRNESFNGGLFENKDNLFLSNLEYLPTHIITKIKWGIGIVIIIQLAPLDHSLIIPIDDFLGRLCSQLETDAPNLYYMTVPEERLLENILSTKIYSNIDDFTHLNNIYHICQHIQKLKQTSPEHCQLSFKMVPINYFYKDYDSTKNTLTSIDTKHINDIETYLLPMPFHIKTLENFFNEQLLPLLFNHLKQQLDRAEQMLSDLKNLLATEIKLFRDVVIDIRNEQSSQEALIKLLNTKEKRSLGKTLDDLRFYLENLKSKKDLLDALKERKIDYLNIATTNVNQRDTQSTLEDKLLKNDRNLYIFCANDYLKEGNQERWNEHLSKLIEKWKNNPNSRLVYADFTYSEFTLDKYRTIYLKDKDKRTTVSSVDLNRISSKNDSRINIVLFGESGVGKSTFINAFANYLLFNDIEQARSGKPIVIIPVSFLMTINDHFEEQIIKFGHADRNENHNDLGQSVTQQCKSYEFDIRDGKRLKIIDTPGFGDTRGVDQDEKNLNEICSYIQNLTHLNGLCILLKPNVKQLNPSFRSSFTQILRLLGDNFYKNIFFCFTNSQSTFFAPGDTSPVLKQFLRTFQENKIDFEKKNTFSFDSESFRYLIASQQSITFHEDFIHQFEQSWFKSVEESNRLVNYICSQEKQLTVNHKWISIEQIKREINHLVRPILEAIRNISRNALLNTNQSFKGYIQLKPILVHPSTLICYKPDRPYQTFGQIHILLDCSHDSSDQCENEHFVTDYTFDYQFVEEKTNYSSDDLNSDLYGIIKACCHFDYFLNENDQTHKNGPFLSGIERMIEEEKSICERVQSSDLNKKLCHRLESSKDQYAKDLKKINSIDEHINLEEICSRIQGIKAMPMIYEQLVSIQYQTDNHIINKS